MEKEIKDALNLVNANSKRKLTQGDLEKRAAFYNFVRTFGVKHARDVYNLSTRLSAAYLMRRFGYTLISVLDAARLIEQDRSLSRDEQRKANERKLNALRKTATTDACIRNYTQTTTLQVSNSTTINPEYSIGDYVLYHECVYNVVDWFYSAAQSKFTYLVRRGDKYYRVNGRELTAAKSPLRDVEAMETEAAKLLAKADEIKKLYNLK